MRTVIVILIVAIVALVAGFATGYIDIDQIRGAQAPKLSTTHNGVVAKGGQAPAFDVETGSVSVGSKAATVKVPALEVQKPANQAATANSANAM